MQRLRDQMLIFGVNFESYELQWHPPQQSPSPSSLDRGSWFKMFRKKSFLILILRPAKQKTFGLEVCPAWPAWYRHTSHRISTSWRICSWTWTGASSLVLASTRFRQKSKVMLPQLGAQKIISQAPLSTGGCWGKTQGASEYAEAFVRPCVNCCCFKKR